MATNLTVRGKGFADLRDQVRALAEKEVLVGFPEETTERRPDEEEPAGMTNAALGYVHDNGQPEVNIPARPFMEPGIRAAEEGIVAGLFRTARQALLGSVDAVDKGLHLVGLRAKLGIQNAINEGVPPPLADSTLRARARRGRKGAKEELARRANGEAPGVDLAKPLVDTAQMRNAVNYVIRDRNKRSK